MRGRLTIWISYAAGIATLFGFCVRGAVAPTAQGEEGAVTISRVADAR